MEDLEVGTLPYNLLTALLLFGGLFTVVCAVKDYDWFMESRRARLFVSLFGRKATRIFYCVVGSMMLLGGFFFVIPLLA